MRFSELDKESQTFLIDQFNILIESRADEENINEYEYPTSEEYETFFDDFDVDYQMVDGYPQTTIEDKFHPKYNIGFDGKKVILNTVESDDDYYEEDDDYYYEEDDDE